MQLSRLEGFLETVRIIRLDSMKQMEAFVTKTTRRLGGLTQRARRRDGGNKQEGKQEAAVETSSREGGGSQERGRGKAREEETEQPQSISHEGGKPGLELYSTRKLNRTREALKRCPPGKALFWPKAVSLRPCWHP